MRTAGPGETLGKIIKGNSYFIVLAAALLLLMAIANAQHVRMATGIETLVFKDTQLYKDIDYYNKHFEGTTFLVLITTDNVYDPAVLDAMQRLDSQIRTNPKVANVTGLQSFAGMVRSSTSRGA